MAHAARDSKAEEQILCLLIHTIDQSIITNCLLIHTVDQSIITNCLLIHTIDQSIITNCLLYTINSSVVFCLKLRCSCLLPSLPFPKVNSPHPHLLFVDELSWPCRRSVRLCMLAGSQKVTLDDNSTNGLSSMAR